MKIYIGMDDTDTLASDYGTGKVVRWFKDHLPGDCRCLGVVRQQLLVSDDIPYTSHNSAACMVVDAPDLRAGNGILKTLRDLAVDHLDRHAADGSDPGLCVAAEGVPQMERLTAYGLGCTQRVSNQAEARQAAQGLLLEGLGGTNDGLIGAAAAVGLTASGWSGRYIEYGNLRQYPDRVSVAQLNEKGIQVVSTGRDAQVPAPGDSVLTNGWLRPMLMGHKPVLLVHGDGPGIWKNIHRKRRKRAHPSG